MRKRKRKGRFVISLKNIYCYRIVLDKVYSNDQIKIIISRKMTLTKKTRKYYRKISNIR